MDKIKGNQSKTVLKKEEKNRIKNLKVEKGIVK